MFMYNIIRIILLLFLLLIFLYALFMIEESIRISHDSSEKPLIILYEESSSDVITYYSIGFRLTNKYGYAQLDYQKDKKVIIGQDLWLFDIFLIWSWIS